MSRGGFDKLSLSGVGEKQKGPLSLSSSKAARHAGGILPCA